MNSGYNHVNFGFEVAEIQHTVEGAIDTILGFDRSMAELETKLKQLLHALDPKDAKAEIVFAIFRSIAGVRFQVEEATDYRAILQRMAPPKQKMRASS